MARASSKGSPAKENAAVTSRPMAFGATLLIILAIPRLARLFYPAIWVEDDFYLEAAWLVRAGMRPYIDFVHPHFPLLEYVSAAYLWIFGASHFSIEVLNEAAIYATSLLTFKLAARVTSRRASISAAILYATSALVFRYHVYERECFVTPLIVAASLLALDESGSEHRRIAWQALALIAACLIKLTAVIEVAVIVGFMALVRRRWRNAIVLSTAIATAMIIATGSCYAMYGHQFLFQTFLFHFMKGRSPFIQVLTYPLQILDIQLPLFAIGIFAVRREIRTNLGIMLILAMVAAEFVFYDILSPTAWPHNYLELLPFIAVVGGTGIDRMIREAAIAIGESGPTAPRARLHLVECGLLIFISLVWIAPLRNQNWTMGSVYGFGFVPRDEISQVGAALRQASRPDEDVLAPAFISFEANRRELMRFPETYGVLREAETEYSRDGFASARAHLGGEEFVTLIVKTAHFWRDPIIQSIRDGKLNAIVPDSEIELFPLVIPPIMLPPDFAQILVDDGFKPVSQTEHFVLWKRTPSDHLRRPFQ